MATEVEPFIARGDGAAPDFLNTELLHVLRTEERRHRIDAERSAAAREAIVGLPIARYPTLPLVRRAWELRHNFSAYDAMYVALAEVLATSLVTADARLASATRAHTDVAVDLISAEM